MIALQDRVGHPRATVRTDEAGAFDFHVAPGRYVLHVEVTGLYPRCEDAVVRVSKQRYTRVNITCDSGMR